MTDVQYITPDPFDKRRGKYVFSAPPYPYKPADNLYLDIDGNRFHYLNGNMKKPGIEDATFSITCSDDGKDVYFDMKSCEVFPVGYVDKILDTAERHQAASTGLRILVACLLVSKLVLLGIIFT